MKQLFFLAIALLLLTSGPTYASGRQNRGYRSSNGGVFSKLVEMERAKNAWLREKFRR
jgi:hypothetical protein